MLITTLIWKQCLLVHCIFRYVIFNIAADRLLAVVLFKLCGYLILRVILLCFSSRFSRLSIACRIKMCIRVFIEPFSTFSTTWSSYYSLTAISVTAIYISFSCTFLVSVVNVDKSSESVRLVDDGFGKICNMMNDISMRVRAEAASLLVSSCLLSFIIKW